MSAAWSADSTTGETVSHEVQFCSGKSAPYADCAAAELRAKADALTTPVAIYEYVRNNYEYALYHGARSGAINTFLGGRGSDVDLAATLIAMLRSRGIPARYVVGTVRVPAAQVANWLAVGNVDLAYHLLRDQGIQGVVLAPDKSTIDFEHVWSEALVPYASYRGAGTSGIDCGATPSACNWVPLDPSFKQRKQHTSGLDPYRHLTFDYPAYHDAIKNNDTARRDRNPLDIYRNQVHSWLQSSAPGKTLEDIPDFTDIMIETNGLLPASLPYATVGPIRRYNSAAEHDAEVPATEKKKWMKYVTASTVLESAGIVIEARVSLVDAATSQFTFDHAIGTPSIVRFRLGGTPLTSLIYSDWSFNGRPSAIGDPLQLTVSMDGAPAPDEAGTDSIIEASYDAIIGGYYLIATGGESSNWSQVHRAARQLLAANDQYKIVFNPADPGANGQACDPVSGINCTPYVDANGNDWDVTDPRLLDSPAALDALTGGLLYVAGTQYYADYRNKLAQLDMINKVKSPINGFLGVVSTTHDVEYIDGTAFSVLPGGLLIDMKGIRFSGIWRIDQPETYSSKHFELMGYIGSSLEHETWQQLTGYDAISTVRGIQMARNAGAVIVNPVKNASTDTVVSMYPSFDYVSAAPAGFTRNVRTLFGQEYVSWAYNGTGLNGFYAMRPDVTGLSENDPGKSIWFYSPASGYDSTLGSYLTIYNQIFAAKNQAEQVPTNITSYLSGSFFQTTDIISAWLTNTSNFVLSSPAYARTSPTQYVFYLNGTGALADGNYNYTINALLSNKDGGALFNGTAAPYTAIAISNVSPGGFSATNPSFSGSNWSFNLKPAGIGNGTHTVSWNVTVFRSGSFGTLFYQTTIEVLDGRIVTGSTTGNTFSYTVQNNMDLTCGGVTYTNLPPATLLGNLQTCFNTYIAANSSHFNFFTPTATLVFRGVPAANDAQLTTQIACIRNKLYQSDLGQVWREYVIPSKLSVGNNFRFGVSILKTHDAATGILNGATFGIVNQQNTSLNDTSIASDCP